MDTREAAKPCFHLLALTRVDALIATSLPENIIVCDDSLLLGFDGLQYPHINPMGFFSAQQ